MTHTDLPIHKHLAQTLNDRLSLLRQTPESILLLGADGHLRQLLQQRYPKTKLTEIDARAEWLAHSAQINPTNLLNKLTQKHQQIQQNWQDKLPENNYQMLISNLTLSFSHDLTDTFTNWANALQTDGMLFFTHLGQDSLPEIRALLDTENIAHSTPLLIDMHDLADSLPSQYFYDIIADTAQLVLTYNNSETLIQDLNHLNAWQLLNIADNDLTRVQSLIQAAHHSGSLTQIILETQFLHAIKKIQLPENEQVVQFYRNKEINR